jgi:hypothetical protein
LKREQATNRQSQDYSDPFLPSEDFRPSRKKKGKQKGIPGLGDRKEVKFYFEPLPIIRRGGPIEER